MNDFEDRLRSRLQGLRDTIEPPPDLWARVEQRTGRRPWIPVTMAAVAAAVLLFALIAGVGGSGGSGNRRNIIAAGPGSTDSTTTLEGGVVGAPPTSQSLETTTSTAVTGTTQPRATTTGPPGTSPTTTLSPPFTTTSQPPVPGCAPSALSYTITTDRPSYAPNTTVQFTLSEQNVSGSPCSVPVGECHDAYPTVYAGDGTKVMDGGTPPGAGACTVPTSDELQPGQAHTVQRDWDERVCSTPTFSCNGPQAAPGTYTAHGLFFDPGTGFVDRAQSSLTIT
jgi:hypothetical protein